MIGGFYRGKNRVFCRPTRCRKYEADKGADRKIGLPAQSSYNPTKALCAVTSALSGNHYAVQP